LIIPSALNACAATSFALQGCRAYKGKSVRSPGYETQLKQIQITGSIIIHEITETPAYNKAGVRYITFIIRDEKSPLPPPKGALQVSTPV
jgi:hypothetical protein